ncbi:MAG: hypothetical protein NHB36_09195 [Nitrospira sp.]|nr:hypothetical protein [Nitrospira sp.]
MCGFIRCFVLGWVMFLSGVLASDAAPADAGSVAGDDLEIEITKKGIGKQVIITQGTKEWFLLIDVTPEHAVVVRQEKDGDHYLVDDTETHDRPMTEGEVDAAIEDYINSVKVRLKRR